MKYQLATINRSWDSILDKNVNPGLRMDVRTYAPTDNPNALCPRRAEVARGGGHKINGQVTNNIPDTFYDRKSLFLYLYFCQRGSDFWEREVFYLITYLT